MDPLTALSLAGTVVQFVEFASTLVTKSSEIYHSSTGSTGELLNLESVYEKLQDCSLELATTSNQHLNNSATLGRQISAVQNLAKACEADCAQLLAAVKKLKVEDGGKTRWGSFRAALKSVFRADEISNLDERLKRTQATLTLHICAITSHYQEAHLAEYDALRRESLTHHVRQHDQLNTISEMLESLLKYNSPIAPNSPAQLLQAQDVDIIEQQMKNVSIATEDIALQQSIISSLRFPSRSARHDSIPDAHWGTFRWTFSTGHNETDGRGRLLHWLKNGTGIFWVSGKPGSGKSTFMKYVADAEETLVALREWASPKEVIVASHYFWVSGTAMQKSRQGLLQTLVFDIFRQYPQMIEKVVDPKWQESGSAASTATTGWTLPKLRQLLQRLASQMELPMKFCLFVDGLDEYDDDHLELVQDLTRLSESPHIKLCVSSRPWNVFEDGLGNNPATKLYIHEVTQADITTYTLSRLSEHPRWAIVVARNSQATNLIKEVTDRSKGVFLWVFLVMRLLRDGLNNDDSYSDLLKRVASFPSDLGDFFRHILTSVEPFYHEKMAGALRLTLAAASPLDALVYYFHDQQYDDADYAAHMAPKVLSAQDIALKRQEAARRINGYCRGLLQLQRDRVEFLHRTVADFLRTREMSSLLNAHSASTFQPTASLLKAYFAWMKSTQFKLTRPTMPSIYGLGPPVHFYLRSMDSLVAEAMICAVAVECEGGKTGDEDKSDRAATSGVLTAIEQFLCEAAAIQEDCSVDPITTDTSFPQQYFRQNLIMYDLSEYLSERLEEIPDYLDEIDLECTYLELAPAYNAMDTIMRFLPPSQRLRTFKVLLENRLDPNKPFVRKDDPIEVEWTPWTRTIAQWLSRESYDIRQQDFMSAVRCGIIRLFLTHGADPNGLIYRYLRRASETGRPPEVSLAWVEFLLEGIDISYSRAEKATFLEILDELFHHGASLSAFPLVNPQPDPCAPGTIYSVFFARLQSVSSRQIVKSEEARFFAEITMRLLLRAKGLGWPMAYIWTTLSSVFGPKQLARMQASYETGIKVSTSVTKRSKPGEAGL